MKFSEDILKKSELAVFKLRELFCSYGYKRYEMSKFEEYELYASNRSFLGSGDIITFTDSGGRLKALRPDVTLSIVKNVSPGSGLTRMYYNENVYRRAGLGHEFRERMQSGLECIGDIGVAEMSEIIVLAVKSLDALVEKSCIDISHMGLIGALLDDMELPHDIRTELLQRIGEKNLPELRRIVSDAGVSEALLGLVGINGRFADVEDELRALCVTEKSRSAVQELRDVCNAVLAQCPDADIRLDFSVVSDLSYYDGIIFQGYAEGIPVEVLSGGRYDSLMRKFGRRQGAIGFAVYIDMLEHEGAEAPSETMVNVALPKGRLGERVYGMFAQAGYDCPGILDDSRKLVFENATAGVRYFWVKPSDVAIYVERGAADIGVAGSDILIEHAPDVYELHDLKIGVCRLAVAAPKEFSDERDGELRVATKFVKVAKDYYAARGRDIDIIALNGSIELAPLLGLSDVIVDIVETGTTLRENGLEVKEEICGVSARLISNKSSFKFKNTAIADIAAKLSEMQI